MLNFHHYLMLISQKNILDDTDPEPAGVGGARVVVVTNSTTHYGTIFKRVAFEFINNRKTAETLRTTAL